MWYIILYIHVVIAYFQNIVTSIFLGQKGASLGVTSCIHRDFGRTEGSCGRRKKHFRNMERFENQVVLYDIPNSKWWCSRFEHVAGPNLLKYGSSENHGLAQISGEVLIREWTWNTSLALWSWKCTWRPCTYPRIANFEHPNLTFETCHWWIIFENIWAQSNSNWNATGLYRLSHQNDQRETTFWIEHSVVCVSCPYLGRFAPKPRVCCDPLFRHAVKCTHLSLKRGMVVPHKTSCMLIEMPSGNTIYKKIQEVGVAPYGNSSFFADTIFLLSGLRNRSKRPRIHGQKFGSGFMGAFFVAQNDPKWSVQ